MANLTVLDNGFFFFIPVKQFNKYNISLKYGYSYIYGHFPRYLFSPFLLDFTRDLSVGNGSAHHQLIFICVIYNTDQIPNP